MSGVESVPRMRGLATFARTAGSLSLKAERNPSSGAIPILTYPKSDGLASTITSSRKCDSATNTRGGRFVRRSSLVPAIVLGVPP